MNVIVNTTILSNFASYGRLDLLRSLLGPVYIATLAQMMEAGYYSPYDNLAELL